MSKHPPLISVVIVHYKTPQLLLECVDSVFQSSPVELIEVIVVDNDSQDNSRELIGAKYSDVAWIDSGYNAGFARANNLGIRQAKGQYVVLLNPDTYVSAGFFQKWLDCYKKQDNNNQLGLLGCRIISAVDNSLLVGTGVGFPSWKKQLHANPIYIKFWKKNTRKKYNAQEMHFKNHEADFISGACVMIKKSKIEQHNLYLDEDFFLYSEDVEWSFRVKKKGFFNYFCAEVQVFHVNSASTGHSENKKKIMFVSELLYFYKTHSKFQFWLFELIFNLNYKLNNWLLSRSGEWDKLEMEKSYKTIFDNYLPIIKSKYKRTPSSAKEYVRYVETH
jgi:GT2 family glycosyltransferase